MRRYIKLFLATALAAFLLTACMHPISEETREQVNPALSSAMVSDNPEAFLSRQLLLGGVVINIEESAEGSMLELMEWRLNQWGEPIYVEDAGRRFLVRSPEMLDPKAYEKGTLVTLSGIILGQETRLLDENEYNYPVLDLTEIHLWESPFRYGIHRHPYPAYPVYVGSDEDLDRQPYDPGYSVYPYTPYWYRPWYRNGGY